MTPGVAHRHHRPERKRQEHIAPRTRRSVAAHEWRGDARRRATRANAAARSCSPTVVPASGDPLRLRVHRRGDRRDGTASPSRTVRCQRTSAIERPCDDALTTCDLASPQDAERSRACREASASASQSHAASLRSRTFCCWTSRPRTWISSTPCPCSKLCRTLAGKRHGSGSRDARRSERRAIRDQTVLLRGGQRCRVGITGLRA